ncbi:MAG: acylphosphatase, partial [Pirellulales bacterium]|nr:acylphosphatase [Pirellulales bacterium]
MSIQSTPSSTIERAAIVVRGVVQGVGFRPFVYRMACDHGLSGWVRNETDLVRIEIQGSRPVLDAFLETLRRQAPPQARIDSIDVRPICVEPSRNERPVFKILPSRELDARRPAIPADLATCGECLAEIRAADGRRRGYPFTNCTNCGPRWSIIVGLPYDRPR